MDVAIVYNFSEHPGGGDLVILDVVEALIENGYNVELYTSYPQGLDKAIRYFQKDTKIAEKIGLRIIDVPRYVKHPYNIYMISKKAFDELRKHDLVIFSDDVPKLAQELKRVLVYVHYPHAARVLLNQLVPYRYKYTLKGKLVWKTHSILFKTYFLTSWNKPNIYVIANSTLTQHHVSKVLKPIHLAKIYPPVQVEQITRYVKRIGKSKENKAVYLGRIQPEKGIKDIIKALSLIGNLDVEIKIIGFNFDNNYLKYLKKLARELKVDKRVEIIANAPREQVLEALAKAKILIHPAHYEPFGIAVVEGMAAGCIPIVRRGFNGPWVDIIEQGRYGYGFNTIRELANILKSIVEGNTIIDLKLLRLRSLEFSEIRFKEKLLKLLNHYGFE